MGTIAIRSHLVHILYFSITSGWRTTRRKGEGQRTRNRIVQKMKHREKLRQEAVARGESVEEWDKIVLQGKKIKTAEEEA